MELKFVNESQYEKDIHLYSQRNFLQSSFEGNKMQHDGWNILYIEGIENGKVQIIGMLCTKPLMKIYKYAYIPRGLLINDYSYFEAFIEKLKRYLKSKGYIYLETDPYVLLRQRDKNGDVVENGIQNQKIVDTYEKCSFHHLPLKQGYDMSKQCRWMSVLNLKGKTKEEVFKDFIPKTRNNIKNTIKNNLKIRPLQKDELHILTDIVKMSSEKQHFKALPLSYYEEQYDYFKNHAQAYYVYLDVKDYAKQIQEEIKQEESVIEESNANLKQNPYSKNSKNRLKVATMHLEALHKREVEAKKLQEEYKEELPLAAAMYITYGNEKVYLMSGSNDTYKSFRGPYALQWYMIQKAIDEHLDYYNFYGISGLFHPGDEGYGVFDFKRGFNAQVVELVGNFILPIHPILFKLYNRLRHVI